VFTDRSDEMIKTKRQQNYSQGYNLSKETLKLMCKSEFEGVTRREMTLEISGRVYLQGILGRTGRKMTAT